MRMDEVQVLTTDSEGNLIVSLKPDSRVPDTRPGRARRLLEARRWQREGNFVEDFREEGISSRDFNSLIKKMRSSPLGQLDLTLPEAQILCFIDDYLESVEAAR